MKTFSAYKNLLPRAAQCVHFYGTRSLDGPEATPTGAVSLRLCPASPYIEVQIIREGFRDEGTDLQLNCLQFCCDSPDEIGGSLVSDYDGWHSIFLAPRVVPSPNATTSITVAFNWMKACIEAHSACSRPEQSQLPTRVLDVSHSGGTDGVRLCVSSELPKEEQTSHYLTLSYCWGAKSTLTTTLATYDEHKCIIPIKQLPRTIQDAVTLTRRFGFRYLWVDALCIIQDKPDDWIVESSRMMQVYEKSAFTIAATDAEHSDAGVLCERQDDGIQVSEFDRDNDIHGSHPVFLRPRAGIRSILGPANLNQRGWALQERILTPAVLHYTRHGMIWECRTECVSESGEGISVHSFAKAVTDDPGTSPQALNFDLWERLVEDYSHRHLTFVSDKPVAIAGLARAVGNELQDQYVAGMWTSAFPAALFWFAEPPDQSFRSPAETNPKDLWPSWSWLSADAQVQFPLIEIRDYEIPGEQNIAVTVKAAKMDDADPNEQYTVAYKAWLEVEAIIWETADVSRTSKDFLVGSPSRVLDEHDERPFLLVRDLPDGCESGDYCTAPQRCKPMMYAYLASYHSSLDRRMRYYDCYLLLEPCDDYPFLLQDNEPILSKRVFRRVGIVEVRCKSPPDFLGRQKTAFILV